MKLLGLAIATAACAANVEAPRDRLPEAGHGALVLLRAEVMLGDRSMKWGTGFSAANRLQIRVRRADGEEFVAPLAEDNIVSYELAPGSYQVVRLDKVFAGRTEYGSVALPLPLAFTVAPADRVVYAGFVIANVPASDGNPEAYDFTEDCYGFDLDYLQRQLPALPWSSVTLAKGIQSASRSCSFDPKPPPR